MSHKCCSKQKVKRGLWSPEEDEKLIKFITAHGHGSWSSVPKQAGLQRCGKSCRLRWINYLRPELKRGSFSAQEEQIIIDVHRILGNKWSQIAKHLPGRTDNEVKNFWNSCAKKKLISHGLDPKTHNLIPSHKRAASKAARSSIISQSYNQQPFSIISMNIQAKDVSMETSAPILTLPAASPANSTRIQICSTDISSTAYENSNCIWAVSGRKSHESSVSTIDNMPIPSPSTPLVNPYGFGLADENLLWGTNSVANSLERPRLEGLQSRQLGNNPKDMISDSQTDIVGDANFIKDMDASFDASSFDIEFMDSTILSGSICRDLSSMDDLTWNF